MPTIKTSEASRPVDLDNLLGHIQRLGIAVGHPERQRLQAVFAQAPVLSRNELRNLFTAVLAKDEWQRSQISRVYDRLIPFDAKDAETSEQSTANSTLSAESRKSRRSIEAEDGQEADAEEAQEPFRLSDLPPKTVYRASLAALLALILLFLLWFFGTTSDAPSGHSSNISQPQTVQPPIEEPAPEPGEKPLELVKTIDHWIPHVESRPRNPWPLLLPTLLLLLGSGLGFSWLLYKVLEASRQQKPIRPTVIKESGRFHVAGVSKPADYHLLSGEQRREISWGISRYQSEQSLNRLNIPLSVRQSATEGMPQLAFEHSSHEREVWLWQDQSSVNPDLHRLVEEISHTLRRANISVRCGYFRGLPSTVSGAQGEVLWSSRHDYPETEPLVAVFADAEQLAQRQLINPEQSERTLRQLSHWPLLCFVDSSQQAGTLQRLLEQHDLHCVLPQAVADWLAHQGQNRQPSTDNCVLDSLHQWAVACALPNRVIMEDEIRALHNALGFDCAWQFHALTRYAKTSGRGFDFRPNRISLLNELSVGKGLSEQARKAVAFWIDRNNDLDSALKNNQQTGAAWENTRKQYLLVRDNALLQLWFGPGEPLNVAAKTLYNLQTHSRLKKDTRRELSYYRCADFTPSTTTPSDTAQIVLPFSWNDPKLLPETQRQLLQSGFGGQADPSVKLRSDNITRGVLAGLALTILISTVSAIYLLLPKPVEVRLQADSAAPPANLVMPVKQGKQYFAGTYKSLGRYLKPDYVEDHQPWVEDEVITVRWERRAALAAQFPVDQDRPETSAQHWLLGTVVQPKRPQPATEKWPDLSIAVIFGDSQNMDNRKLAAKLLDTGSADQVLLGRGKTLRQQHAKLLNKSQWISDSQWIYINGPVLRGHEGKNARIAKITHSPKALLGLLQQSNNLLSINKFKWATLVSKGSSPLLQAEKSLTNTIELANQLTLVKIPRGSFQMGSDKGSANEKPVHTVNFNYDFWMSQTEITFEQYDAYIAASGLEKPKDWGWRRGSRPVISVSWNDAQGYVKWLSETNREGLQCRLPSEAEWEYAARGGSTTEYPWGDEIGNNNANCDGCGGEWDGKQTAPVGRFKPNAFGLYDMHGNVWEWVQDSWHGNYTGAPDNGDAWEGSDDSRVLRGGSWFHSPGVLRSADRDRYSPDLRSFTFGFRIVCSSH